MVWTTLSAETRGSPSLEIMNRTGDTQSGLVDHTGHNHGEHLLSHLVLAGGRRQSCCPHCAVEETEAYRGSAAGPGSHSWEEREPGLERRQSGLSPCT